MTDLLLQSHVVISLIGIVSGLIVLFGMLTAQRMGAMTALFLATTVLTSATGLFLPPFVLVPPRIVGIISLAALAVALLALYGFRLGGAWRWIYVITATIALFFNCFVAVVQALQKVAFLHALAPTQTEPPFKIAQLALLAIFIVLGIVAVIRFHPKPATA